MFKKLKYLFYYIKILKRNKEQLRIEHDISIDWVYRMYKTYTIPDNAMDNIKLLGVKYFNDILKKEINKIDQTFVKIGISEFVGLMEVIELNDMQVGMAFRFKFLNTAKIFGTILWLFLHFIFGLFGFLIANYIGMGIGLLSILMIYLISRIFI
ncbi:MAG: hypothetical protein WDA02_06745 [Saccharofermentanales bacterium]